MADVRDGLGPYLGIFLLTTQHWNAAQIGTVLTVMGVATLIAQTPAGAFIDFTRYKRATIAVVSIVIAMTASLTVLFPHFWWVVSFKAAMGLATAFIAPTIAALTLGLVGPGYFTRQIGKNEAYNHIGNVVASLMAGFVGYWFSSADVFYVVAVMVIFSIISLSFIDQNKIDHEVARGFTLEQEQAHFSKASGFKLLFSSAPLLIFTVCITLFHLANAAMLPLLGQWLAIGHAKTSTLFMSACIVTAQITMVPMAILVGKKADSWGRKKIFLLGFMVLPIRGVLYTLWHDPVYLVLVQILDGVGAGIFGVLFFVVIADLTKGTGRYNVTQGIVSTIMGVGAAFSTMIAGEIVVHSSYNIAFLSLAAIAFIAFILFLFFMPETYKA